MRLWTLYVRYLPHGYWIPTWSFRNLTSEWLFEQTLLSLSLSSVRMGRKCENLAHLCPHTRTCTSKRITIALLAHQPYFINKPSSMLFAVQSSKMLKSSKEINVGKNEKWTCKHSWIINPNWYDNDYFTVITFSYHAVIKRNTFFIILETEELIKCKSIGLHKSELGCL